jgi:N6-L-threonylcarbamoyladenine synthase
MSLHILAIESSCDETSAAVISNGKVLNNIIATQRIHQKYGGVVPELASRAHQQNIVMVVKQALAGANMTAQQLHAIAFTRGPGLAGALMVGVSFAKGMALALDVPMIDVNHMQAHIMAHFIDERKPAFPFLCLTVSGGHTQLVLVKDFLDFHLLGQTRDDAVGEAFDKGAKMLGLPYPGGPMIDHYAKQGDANRFNFPVSTMPGWDFSFSGIKTALLYLIRDNVQTNPDFVQQHMADICASYQKCLVDMLMIKLKRAAKEMTVKHIALAGGVAANAGLRHAVKTTGDALGWEVFIPAFEYCTDNAAMIAITAHYKYLRGEFCGMDVSPVASFNDL